MTRLICLTGIVLIVFGQSLNSQKSGIQSLWHGENIHQLSVLDYMQDKDIFYLVSNNQDTLFLSLIVPKSDDQKKILLFGMTIYIDPMGKSKKDFVILFPFRRTGGKYKPENISAADSLMFRQMFAGESMDSTRTDNENRQNMRNPRVRALANFESMKYGLAERNRFIVLKGFTDTADVIAIPSSNPREVRGWMNFDAGGILHYTIALPLEKVPIKKIASASGFSIGIETGFFNPGQTQANNPQAMGRQGGRRSGGGGRGGGGAGASGLRGPGGGSGMSPQQRQDMLEQMEALKTPIKFWIKKISLAEKE
jgi:hypothetical protein